MTVYETLVSNIKYKLQQDGELSVNQLEKRANLRPSSVQSILSGRSKNPGIKTVIALAKEFGCNIEELVYSKLDLIHNVNNEASTLPPWEYQLSLDASRFIVEFLLQKAISLSLSGNKDKGGLQHNEQLEVSQSKSEIDNIQDVQTTSFNDFLTKTSITSSNLDLIMECIKVMYIHGFEKNNITVNQKLVEWNLGVTS